jgi:prefoldin subunit 5
MKIVLPSALRESCGYMQDEGWHQTARLMSLAADEIEGLAQRIRELEEHLSTLDEAAEALQAPEASNQNAALLAVSARR